MFLKEDIYLWVQLECVNGPVWLSGGKVVNTEEIVCRPIQEVTRASSSCDVDFLSLGRLPGAALSSPSDQPIDPCTHHSEAVSTNRSRHGSPGRDEGLAPGVSGWMGEVSWSQLEPNPTQDCSIPG